MVCECTLFSAFCVEITQCNTDMKIENNSARALSTGKLLSNIYYTMLQIAAFIKNVQLMSKVFI